MVEQSQKVLVADLPLTAFESMEAVIKTIFSEKKLLPGFAIAINAEKVVASMSDPEIRNIIQQGTLLYPDGIAVVKTMKKKGVASERIPGCELWLEFMKRVSKTGQHLYLLGASEETNKITAEKLKEQFSIHNLTRRNGYFDDEKSIVDEVARLKPGIVTVALGSPKQELLIAKLRQINPDAFYMGVGGSYDVFVGKVKRAPIIFRRLHIEWLFRLLMQPKRVFRCMPLLKYAFRHYTNQL